MSASGEGGGEPRFPGPVVFNEDDPKPGHVTLFLKVPGLKVSKPFFGKPEAKNAVIKPEFKPELVKLDINLTNKDGTQSAFVYKKNTPEDIDDTNTHFEVATDKVILHICKKNKASWVEHKNFFIDPSK